MNLNLTESVWIPGGEGKMLPIFGRSGQGRNGNTWHGALSKDYLMSALTKESKLMEKKSQFQIFGSTVYRE